MADIIEGQQQSQETAGADAAKAELAQMMAISLNGGIAPQEEKKVEATPGDATAGNENQPPVVTDIFAPFKEKYGYQTPEDAFKEIEALRAFKDNPTAEFEYENEESEKLFKAILKGDRKEVYKVLAQQERLDAFTSAEITKDNVDNIIKFGMSLKYKDLTPKEIDYKFSKQFALPKEPVQGADELDTDFEARKSEWATKVSEIEMDKIIEAKQFKPDLENAKRQLVLPEIDDEADPTYLQWLETMEKREQEALDAKKEYQTFKPENLTETINFTDETNKVAVNFQFTPDAESFGKTISIAADMDVYKKEFTNADGTYNRKKFLEVMYFGLNRQKVITEAMNQSKNATLKALLPDNSQGGLVRQLPQQQGETSELDKQMKIALAGHI